MSLLEVKGASVEFRQGSHVIRAADDVSLSIEPGESVAVVGESGSGKTTLARAILGLQPLSSGEIRFRGEVVRGIPRDQAKRIGMVWQDPYASLDPRWTIERSLGEPGVLNQTPTDIPSLMSEIGLDSSLAKRLPGELSGGQRQRVAIGRALAMRPPLVICDEPTAALDLSVQAQILNLLKDLQESQNLAYLYISHDLMTVRFIASRVLVMQAGKVVEEGPTDQVFDHPQHPYTQALLAAAPLVAFAG